MLSERFLRSDGRGGERKKWETQKVRSHGICLVVPRPKDNHGALKRLLTLARLALDSMPLHPRRGDLTCTSHPQAVLPGSEGLDCVPLEAPHERLAEGALRGSVVAARRTPTRRQAAHYKGWRQLADLFPTHTKQGEPHCGAQRTWETASHHP